MGHGSRRDRIAIIDVAQAREGRPDAVRSYLSTINGPAQAWFSADGRTAFVVSQKASAVDVFPIEPDAAGFSRPRKLTTLDIAAQDKFGFTPFLKTSPDGAEVWLSHKLADGVSALGTKEPFGTLDVVSLGQQARPNHVNSQKTTAAQSCTPA
jgi:hypothetical protein